MSHRPSSEHPSAEQLQAFFDGELPPGAARSFEEHLGGCPACAAELDGLHQVVRELEGLPRLVPFEGFADRVLQDVRPPEHLPLAARVSGALARLVPGPWGHPGPARIQDWVEGLLPATRSARVAHHVGGCPGCGREAAAWQDVLARLDALDRIAPPEGFATRVMERRALEAQLDRLGRLAPSEGFAARVMAQVSLPRPAAAPAPAVLPSRAPSATPATAPAWGGLLAVARRLVPRTRQAWAALSGVAVTPVVTLGLMLWVMFRHPTLTPGALVSFGWWKVSDLAMLAWNASAGPLLETAGVFQVVAAAQSVMASPAALVAGLLAFSVVTVMALWVLYKNLFVSRSGNGRYAHASL